MTNGPIERFKEFVGIDKKKPKKKKKSKPAEGSTFRDYRGPNGVVEDAEKGKEE